MLFRLLSDLHEEHHVFDYPYLETDSITTLILAGDIDSISQKEALFETLQKLSNQFKHIIYVFGNHELYNSNFTEAAAIRDEINAAFDNVYVLENDVISLDGISIIGATLWTDFDKCNPLLVELVKDSRHGLSDYKYINKDESTSPNSESKIDPQYILNEHHISKEFIFSQIQTIKSTGNKILVVTHHGPTWASIQEGYVCNSLNGAYVSDLSNEILDNVPDVWVHGHVHGSKDYWVGDTRVICNARGYPHEQGGNAAFDPFLLFEV